MAKPDPQMSSCVSSGSAVRNSACQAGLLRDRARLATPVCHTLKSQIQSKPQRARSSSKASSTVASVTGCPASCDNRRSHALVLISNSPSLFMQLGDHIGDQGTPSGLVRGAQATAGVAVVVFVE